jgi:hypothetical protein
MQAARAREVDAADQFREEFAVQVGSSAPIVCVRRGSGCARRRADVTQLSATRMMRKRVSSVTLL